MRALRKKNAHYHPPAVAVQLGTVLDLVIDQGEQRVKLSEWEGWLMLTDEDAMERADGKARLYLFDAKLKPNDELEHGELDLAEETYERWHEREPRRLGELADLPDEIGFFQGRVLNIGYCSDKWEGEGNFVDYDHSFTERDGKPPLMYTDRAELEQSKAAVLVGGDMRVTEQGID